MLNNVETYIFPFCLTIPYNYSYLILQPSKKPEEIFKDNIVQFKIVCLGTADQIKQIFLSGEDKCFCECPLEDGLSKCLVQLICMYYVYDVNYPETLSGILYFLQDVALNIRDTGKRWTKYSTFLAELRNSMES